jgi:hypothetical protein
VGLVVLGCGALAPLAAPTPALACPNEQVRTEKANPTNPATGQPYSATLPDCRAYEMVSPLYKEGQNARPIVLAEGPEAIPVAPDGNAVGFFSVGTFSNPENYLVQKNGAFNPYVSVRGASGWRTTASAPPAAFLVHPYEEALAADFSPDLRTKELSCGNTQNFAAVACVEGTLGTSWKFGTPLYPFAEGKVAPVNKSYLGASRDLSRAFIEPVGEPDIPLRASDSTPIYEIAGVGEKSPRLRKVNVDNAGNELKFGATEPPLLGASGSEHNGTTFHAISEDGKTVYFAAAPHGGEPEPTPTVFARVQCEPASATCTEDNEGGEISHEFFETVAISNPSPSECQAKCVNPARQPAVFQGASADGKIAFFTTAQELLAQDTDTTNDLYAYDFSRQRPSERLVQISAGEANPEHPIAGEGAEVIGVVRSSADGSHVYFLASGVLTSAPNGNGEKAQLNGENLYGYGTKEVGVLREPLNSRGAAITSLPTKPLNFAIPNLSKIVLNDGAGHTEEWTVTAEAPAGSESISVSSQTPAFSFPATTTKIGLPEVKFVSHGNASLLLGPPTGEFCCSDTERHAQTTPDGRYLVFSTFGELQKTGHTGPGAAVYRYDFATGELVWVSHGAPEYKEKCEAELEQHGKQKSPAEKAECENEGKDAVVSPLLGANGGAKSSGSPGGSEADSEDWNRAISENGEFIIFTTEERLQGDHEGPGAHVYSWHNDGHKGTVGMISPPGEAVPGHLPASGMSATGSDIFFLSRAQLVGQDTDGLVDVYDARIGGGFPAPTPEPSCSGDACQGSSSPTPSFGAAASSLSAAGGNLPAGTIVGGEPPPTKPASKPPTRAQQLAKALKACRARPRKRRATCEAQARKRYGSKGKAKSRKRGGR